MLFSLLLHFCAKAEKQQEQKKKKKKKKKKMMMMMMMTMLMKIMKIMKIIRYYVPKASVTSSPPSIEECTDTQLTD